MDEYSLENVYEYILDLSDKKGSDLFQADYVRKVFITKTVDFIGEHINVFENTGSVTQDIEDLVKTTKETVLNDPDDVYAVISTKPNDLHYLASVRPLFKGNVASRKPKIIRHGEINSKKSNPFQRPSPEYPIITQYSNLIKIDSGYNEKAIACLVTYIRKPIYAPLSDFSKRIVDLPDESIEAIIQKCVYELISGKGDQRTEIAYRNKETFRDINK